MDGRVADLLASLPLQELLTVTVDQSIDDVIQLMTKRGISQVPVLSLNGELLGMVTEQSLIQAAHSPQSLQKYDVGRVMDRSVPTVDAETSLSTLQRLLMQRGRAVVVDRDRKPMKIMTSIDLVEWMMNR
jgi:cystathionine beta-synthase